MEQPVGWTRELFRLLKWTVLAVVGFWDMKAVAVQSTDDIDGDGHPRNVFTVRQDLVCSFLIEMSKESREMNHISDSSLMI